MKIQKSQIVEQAKTLITEAILLLEVATENDANAQAYLLDHLRIMTFAHHGYLSSDLNLDNLIDRYQDEEVELTAELEDLMNESF